MITLVPPDKNMIVSNSSGGNQQKVVIGKWLAMSPRILLLNDPTKGVDVETRMHFYKIVRGLAQNGTSVLFYSTDTDELVANCDRVLGSCLRAGLQKRSGEKNWVKNGYWRLL